MNDTPILSWSDLAQFVRQHTHDLRNELNGLDLEASLLADELAEGPAEESLTRMRVQLRRVGVDLRTLAAKFTESAATRSAYDARELFLIWQDQICTLLPAPIVQWSEAIGAERIDVDAAGLAVVFRELLANAQAFAVGQPLVASVRCEGLHVIFELHEPKHEAVETSAWGKAPFTAMRRGHYGLGLWVAQRTIAASGGEISRRFDAEVMELITTLRFPVV